MWGRLNEWLSRKSTLRLLAFLPLVLGLFQLSGEWNPTPDSCSYLSMARSFAATGTMTNLGREFLYYSPGFPLLISPLFLWGEPSFFVLSLVQYGLYAIFCWQTYVWARRHYFESAELITLLATGSMLVTNAWHQLLSEPAFMAVMMLLVNTIDVALYSPSQTRRLLCWPCALLLALYLPLIRHAGLLIVLGLSIAHVVISLQKRTASKDSLRASPATRPSLKLTGPLLAVLMFGVAVAGEWALHAHQRELAVGVSHPSYLEELRPILTTPSLLLETLSEGIRLRSEVIARILVPGVFKAEFDPTQPWGVLATFACVALMGWLVMGWWKSVRSLEPLSFAFPLYLGLHLVWPHDQGGRFLVPMAGLLVAYWVTVLKSLPPVTCERWMRITAVCGLLHVAIGMGHWVVKDIPDRQLFATQFEQLKVIKSECDKRDFDPARLQLQNLSVQQQIEWAWLNDRIFPTANPNRAAHHLNGDKLSGPPQWVVSAEAEKLSQHFQSVSVAGDVRLWRRQNVTRQAALSEDDSE
ncbi:hypothetical protein [Calycomorphotria hydatis]|uniref:Glycosyltransferase RgtA/B/C/D-like domain-containing protein n=1 Tax=Calycomorphotria hydatis TaxID=2528027 RepID=A0A517T546_9PLAN|nr:hypothetical protein [Calycomorphotria hydatis]QDT63497.1 hypothetical protein V22_07190 [Calycomorphotria hydatis]